MKMGEDVSGPSVSYHKQSGLNTKNHSEGHPPSAGGEDPSCLSSSRWPGCGSVTLSLPPQGVSSPMCPPFDKDILTLEERPSQLQYDPILTTHICIDCFQIRSHSGARGEDFNISFCGERDADKSQPLTRT